MSWSDADSSISSELDTLIAISDQELDGSEEEDITNMNTSETTVFQIMMQDMQTSSQIVEQLERAGINTRMMLFALTEQELRVDFQVPLHTLVKIRLAKQAFDRESSHVQISAGLLGALPEFRGTGPRGMDDTSGFLIRFEAVLESANVQLSRWSAMLTLCLTTPEDTTYWRAYLNMNRDLEWREYRANFLKHFEKYDQRSKYIEQLHQLKQKPSERVQGYMDRALELVRRAGVSTRDRLVIDGVRRGLYRQELKSFLSYKETPDTPFSFSELVQLCLLGEDRLGLEPLPLRQNNTVPKKQLTKRCAYCNRSGHEEEQCWKRQKKQQKPDATTPTTRVCKNCPRADHSFSDCPKNVCALCKQTGHRDYGCPTAKCVACGLKGHTASAFSCKKHPKHKANTVYDPVMLAEVQQYVELKEMLNRMNANPLVMVAEFIKRSQAVVDQPGGRILVPVMIEGHRLMALLDTGATHSIIG